MIETINTVLAKVESVYGTDSAPAVTDAIPVIGLSDSFEGEKLVRQPFGGSMSPVAHKIGQKWANVSFSVEVRGSGTLGTPPEISPLLRACGLGETINVATSVVYQPISSGFESCTLHIYKDGIIEKMTGCRGTVEKVFEAGQFIKFNFNMSGRYQTPVDGVFVAGSYDSIIPPEVAVVGFTAGGYAAIVSSLQVALNNKVSKIKDINSIGRIEIVGRETSGSFDPEAVLEATHPFWSRWENSTPEAMTLAVGDTDGNIIQLDIAQAVYDSLTWADKDGIQKYDTPFVCARNSGDDEVVLTFR